VCTCEHLIKIEVKILRVVRDHGNSLTVINGIRADRKELRNIARDFKTACHCGGTVKNRGILLQGLHSEKVKMILVEQHGLSPEQIEII